MIISLPLNKLTFYAFCLVIADHVSEMYVATVECKKVNIT